MNTTSTILPIKGLPLAGKYLTFALSKEKYGIEILKVQEIIGVTHITRVPKSDSFIKGVINLRGTIIPVIDLRLRFRMKEIPYDDKTCIIVVNISRGDSKVAVGIIVDTVLEVTTLDGSMIEAAPDYGASLDTKFILGMGRKDANDLLILIDIDRVLIDADLSTVAAT